MKIKGNFKKSFVKEFSIECVISNIANNKFGIRNQLSVSHKISDVFELRYNLGHINHSVIHRYFTYAINLNAKISDKWKAFVEPFGSFHGTGYTGNVAAGVSFQVLNNFQLDLSSGLGLEGDKQFSAMGFSWMLGRK